MGVRLPLRDGWTVRPSGGDVPDAVAASTPVGATVPGVVHTDLMAAGLIPDPLLDDHERLLGWIGRADWLYETELPTVAAGHERIDLVFAGLDTVAAVTLDRDEVGRTANMHRAYRFDVTDRVKTGARRLAVDLASAVGYADNMSLQLGARPHANAHPYNAIRKMACNFGWDWGPDVVTAGIWRPAWLHAWSVARLAALRPHVTVHGRRGTVTVDVTVERDHRGAQLNVTAAVAGVMATTTVGPDEVSATVVVEVDDVALWWPCGHGDQPLYELTVTLSRAGEPFDQWTGRIGFRNVEVRTPPDRDGTSFEVVVNGRPILVRGVNWIPDDVFPHRVTRERYAWRLAQAADAGVNLVRVWGGGIYESDDFYAECDERGLLVWQDFMFACAAYSEDEPLRSEVTAEARDNVTRLMAHPSLALWNGNNENLWGFADPRSGWQRVLDGRSWGAGYYHDVLPAIVAELDPTRPYVPGSPWSPPTDRDPNAPAYGTTHLWDVWNDDDYASYRDVTPRFVAEFGWQGPPAWATLRTALSDDPLTPESPGMQVHQKAEGGHRKLTAGLVPHFRVPDDMDDWHWAMALNQARAVRVGIEHFRALAPVCAGSVLWQLNDCWPVVSWAMVDGAGRRKPAWYALRAAHADRLLTIQPRDGVPAVVLVNDTDDPWDATITASRRRVADGGVVATADLTTAVPTRAARTLRLPAAVAVADDPSAELLAAHAGDRRAWWFFAEDRDGALAPPQLTTAAVRTSDGYRVKVTATTVVRDLAVLADRVEPDAVVDDMLTTLLPGEDATFAITSDVDVDPDAFLAPQVLRSANQLVARAAVRL